MNKAEITKATDIMRALIRMARNPLVTRKGNAMIAKFVSSETPKKKEKEPTA